MRSRAASRARRVAGVTWLRALSRALGLCVALLLLAAPAVHAQAIALRVQPSVGDTMRMRMEQRVEMTDMTPRPGTQLREMVATVSIFTRAVALARSARGTEMLSVTDSVTVAPAAAAESPMFADVKRALQGKSVRLAVAPDGAITVGDAAVATGVRAALGQTPAMLPAAPVLPGDSWTRTMQIPVGTAVGAVADVRAVFRFDSLAARGDVAYLSLRGTLAHGPSLAHTPGAHTDVVSGTVAATIELDRRLAWITSSRTELDLTADVPMAGQPKPSRVRMKITQSLRAVTTP